MPLYVDVEGRVYNQTTAIILMLARKHGMTSADAEDYEETYIDEWALDSSADLNADGFGFQFLKPQLTHEDR